MQITSLSEPEHHVGFPEHQRTDAARDVVYQSGSPDANVASASRVWLAGGGDGGQVQVYYSYLLNQKVYEYLGMPAVGIPEKQGWREHRGWRWGSRPPAPHSLPRLIPTPQPPPPLHPTSLICGRNRATIAAPVVESTSRLIKMKWAAESQGAF